MTPRIVKAMPFALTITLLCGVGGGFGIAAFIIWIIRTLS